MSRDSSDGIEKYTTSVTGFLNKCTDNFVPTVTVRTYPNQKPWITGNIRTELKGRAAAFKKWDSNPVYNLIRNPAMPSDEPSNRQSVNTGPRLKSYYTGYDTRRMWQGLQTIIDYKGKHSRELPSDEPTRRAKCLLCMIRGKQH